MNSTQCYLCYKGYGTWETSEVLPSNRWWWIRHPLGGGTCDVRIRTHQILSRVTSWLRCDTLRSIRTSLPCLWCWVFYQNGAIITPTVSLHSKSIIGTGPNLFPGDSEMANGEIKRSAKTKSVKPTSPYTVGPSMRYSQSAIQPVTSRNGIHPVHGRYYPEERQVTVFGSVKRKSKKY